MSPIDQATDKLIAAAWTDNLAEARSALEQGGSVDGRSLSATPEHFSAPWGLSRSPLVGAVVAGNEDLVVLLLAHNATIPKRNDGDGNSVWTKYKVVQALIQGNTNILKRLLEAGMDPNIQDPQGKTLLHQIIEHGTGETTGSVASVLLEHHADWQIVTTKGCTAEELAEDYLKAPGTRSSWSSVDAYRAANARILAPILRAVREQNLLRRVAESHEPDGRTQDDQIEAVVQPKLPGKKRTI